MNYAKTYIGHDWQNTIFLDEANIELFPTPNKQNIRDRRSVSTKRRKLSYVKKLGIRKFGVMLGIHYRSKMKMIVFAEKKRRVRKTKTSSSYTFNYHNVNSNVILQDVLPTVIDWYKGVGATNMLWDGHSGHISNSVTTCLQQNNVNFISFSGRGSNVVNGYPPRSNDFNPTENVIGAFKEAVFLQNPKTMLELWNTIFRVWEDFEVEYWTRIIDSIDDRLQQCIDRDGYKTD